MVYYEEDIVMAWNSSALWGIVGIIGGAVVSFIFYIYGNKVKRIVYTVNSQVLITDNLSSIAGLNIIYQNKTINNLTSTTINFKSIGKDTVEMHDFGQATPLCIKTTGEFLLQSDIDSIVASNSNPNNLLKPILMDDKTIELEFDYFSKGDAITFTILHTGAISVVGKLKDGKVLDNNAYEKFNHISNIVAYVSLGIALIVVAFLYVLFNGVGNVFVDIGRYVGSLLLGMVLISFYKGNK